MACSLTRRALCALSVAAVARAQAVVEYAAKSAVSAGSGTPGGASLGACRVDSTLISCLRQNYPVAFQVVLVVICLLAAVLVFRPRQRA
jgi:hypothetical protein